MKQESCEYLLGPVATQAKCTDTGKWRNQRPVINDHCKCCQQCISYCPCGVIQINTEEKRAEIDYRYCKGCFICYNICKLNAIDMIEEEIYGKQKK